jgi:hypothetical protein
MKKNIENPDKASACLSKAPKDFEISSVKLMLQIPESRDFFFIDINSAWIATAIGESTFKYKRYSLAGLSAIIPIAHIEFNWKLQASEFFMLALLDNEGKIILKFSSKFREVEKLALTLDLISEALEKEPLKLGNYLGSLAGVSPRVEDSVTSLSIWENILITELKKKYKIYQMTHDVKAELYTDGELSISYTDTRFGSASHGSKGLNLLGAAIGAPRHNKMKTDTRSLRIEIFGPKWVVAINCDPDNLNQARTMVTQINRNLEIAKNESSGKAPSDNTNDISESLKKLADLKSQGLLSDDEFAAAKDRLLK